MSGKLDVNAVVTGFVGLFGAALGSSVTGYMALQIANSQIQLQQEQFQANSTMEVMKYIIEPLENLYSAKSNFDAAKLTPEELVPAAKALAAAASVARARLGGDGEKHCESIQDSATLIASYGDKLPMGEQIIKLNDSFSNLNYIYQGLRKTAIEKYLKDPHFTERCDVCRSALGDMYKY